MRFRILGPLEVGTDEVSTTLRGRKQRVVLAGLLLHANQVVPSTLLARYLWDDAPPGSWATALRTHVLWLRKELHRELRREVSNGPEEDAPSPVVTKAGGYAITVARGELDLDQFCELTALADRSFVDESPATARNLLENALALWRGQALAGIDSAALARTEVPRLEEQRLLAIEKRIEADLTLARHAEVVAELRTLAETYPLRERFRYQLMLALYRSGRRGEALQVYRDTWRRLAEDLGIEPGPNLRRIHEAVLAGDPALDPPVPAQQARLRSTGSPADRADAHPIPAELPPDLATFAGRVGQLARLDELLDPAARRGSVAICAIHGGGGVGKSALAIRAAHRVIGAFSDGQLYTDLRGATTGLAPLNPADVLGRWLRGLGVHPTRVPAEAEEASARFRSLTAGRRLLVVCDNAADAAQVRPLLPASPGCAVLVTSRQALVELDGATHLGLDVMAEDEAVTLLARVAGIERVTGDAAAAARIVGLCGYLPLAVRIAGARLAVGGDWSLGDLAGRLGDWRRRLDELQLAELGVRASYAVSYQSLQTGGDPVGRHAARAFCLLGLHDGPDIDVPVAGALLGQPVPETQRALDFLVTTHLLDLDPRGRYRMHDLVRLFAREQAAATIDPEERDAAFGRLLDCYLATARRASRLLNPAATYRLVGDDPTSHRGIELRTRAEVGAWADAERDNLVAATRQAATPDAAPRQALRLVGALHMILWIRGHWRELKSLNELAVDVAQRVGEPAAAAQSHEDLGIAIEESGGFGQAMDHYRRALTIRRELGDRVGEARCLSRVGFNHRHHGRLDEAIACYRQSLAAYEDAASPAGRASALTNLGVVYQNIGRLDEAIAAHRDALVTFRELGSGPGEGRTLGNLAEAHRRAGDMDSAVACYEEALAVSREIGDRFPEAEQLWGLGLARDQLGHHREARECWKQAIDILHELGLLGAEEAVTLRDSSVPPTPEAIRLRT